ncbi:MAG: thymidine phosphorylase [Bacilli bacterium]
MQMYDIIEKKKNKLCLSKEEINFFVNEYTNGYIPDYQMSALLMAIVLNGMNDEEITNLTLAMAKTGDQLDLSKVNGKTVDKHSTGGVGDKTTLIVAPIVACLNCKVAKMSGKSLGYTGGTIDKLESIKGFKTTLTEEQFIKQVNDINIAIISQTVNIAPADKKIYTLRDATATVESIPLIASSIMSKKIASGSKNLVIDVKVGNGAFMKDLKQAQELALKMVNIGKMVNLTTVAILTNMNSPLGNNIGNSLEVMEAMLVLQNKGPEDLKTISIALATYMNALTNDISLELSKQQVLKVIQNGQAYNKFLEFVKYQGGQLTFKQPQYKYQILSKKEGYITAMNTQNIGKISSLLGSGRKNKEDTIDYASGIVINKKTGDYVKKNTLLATLYSCIKEDLNLLEDSYLDTLTFSNNKPIIEPLIFNIIN